jgi:dolichyl-diphosphooligosaccharide--protein glycosyltransferase
MDPLNALRVGHPLNKNVANITHFVAMALIYIIAFSTRLFSVLRFESVIHEFDPYFNYRTTKFLSNEGFYSFHNWFDDRAWYPLGRIIGGTIYPGLMITAALVYWVLNAISIAINIRNVCVFLAPWMASNTTLVAYLLTKEVMTGEPRDLTTAARQTCESKASRAALLAAAFIAIVPGYISRSVAGSYDNEGVAIFALLGTYYLWVKAVHTGSLFWSASCALAYFYMVSAWGGYIFIINLIPIFVVVMVVMGRYSTRLYSAYCSFYILGTLLSMQISFVGFQPVYSSEHLIAMGVFGMLQLIGAIYWVKGLLSTEQWKQLMRALAMLGLSLLTAAVVIGTMTGYIAPWTGRFYSLLDPSYAKNHIPIIASVSEHQPTTWASFFFDMHCLVFLLPAGVYYVFKNPTEGKIFLVLYAATATYFAGVMVRLMLVLAPIACVMGAIAITEVLSRYLGVLKDWILFSNVEENKKEIRRRKLEDLDHLRPFSLVLVLGVTLMLTFYAQHCAWVTAEAYSSPSIVLAAKGHDGNRIIFDDFREAYWWLRQNTPEDAKVMSWWDYGYQITGMANRTILVDNNTWNNTHIATVGRAMASSEEEAYPIMQSLDVDYVLVIFGGVTGYASDDINKFLWMVRIGGGVFPHIVESDYFTQRKEFRVDENGSPTLLNCLMYKLCYWDFGRVHTEQNKPTGYDRVREVEIGNKDFELQHLEEAMTSEHWIVRIYRVLPEDNRE